MLPAKLESPLYFAVMECAPAVSEERVSWAEAPERFAEPSEEPPSKKVTVPVGVPLAEDWIEAVKVTDWPKADGFRLETTVVVVAAGLTVCVSAAEVLAEKLASLLYFAVMECAPEVKVERESWAALLETVDVPSEVEPSKKVTVPVAVPPKAG